MERVREEIKKFFSSVSLDQEKILLSGQPDEFTKNLLSDLLHDVTEKYAAIVLKKMYKEMHQNRRC